MSSARQRRGSALISMLVVFSMATGAILIASMQSRAVFEITKSLDIENQRYAIERTLKNVAQESLLSFMEQRQIHEEVDISKVIEMHLAPLTDDQGVKITTLQTPGSIAEFISLPDTPYSGNGMFMESVEHKELGFSIEQYLEAGPYIYLGEEAFEFEYELSSHKGKNPVTIAAYSVAIPVTNLECIEYSLGLEDNAAPLEGVISFGENTRTLSFPSFPSQHGKQQSLPYQFRYLASITHNLFHLIWSNQFRDNYLRLSYKDGYFSRESWPVKQFEGMSYDKDSDTAMIDLAAFKGNRLAIVDKAGALSLKIYGATSDSRPITVYVISYNQAKTIVSVESDESQIISGYFNNSQIHFSSYRGALFASPKTVLVTEKATLKGSLFYHKNSGFLKNCRHLSIECDLESKVALKERSPKFTLVKTKVITG